jgi:hypothetical protein
LYGGNALVVIKLAKHLGSSGTVANFENIHRRVSDRGMGESLIVTPKTESTVGAISDWYSNYCNKKYVKGEIFALTRQLISTLYHNVTYLSQFG